MMSRAVAAVVALAFVAVACGVSEEAGPPSTPTPTPVPTLGGVGKLPDTIPPSREPLVLVTRPPAESRRTVYRHTMPTL